MTQTGQSDSPEMPKWLWIRFIPVKLHIIGLWVGIWIGYMVDSFLRTGGVFSVIFGGIGAFGGILAQYKKMEARKYVTELIPFDDYPTVCPHCETPLMMKSFRLYLFNYVTRCPNCKKKTRVSLSERNDLAIDKNPAGWPDRDGSVPQAQDESPSAFE